METPKNSLEIFKFLNDPITKSKIINSKARINPFAVTCQILLETGNLKHFAYHNYAGIKATKSWINSGGKIFNAKTKEEYKIGNISNIIGCFRVYDNFDHFISNYTHLIGNYYPICNLNHDCLFGYFYGLIKNGWATDSRYFINLSNVAEPQATLLRGPNGKNRLKSAAELFISRYKDNPAVYKLTDKNKEKAIIDFINKKYLI